LGTPIPYGLITTVTELKSRACPKGKQNASCMRNSLAAMGPAFFHWCISHQPLHLSNNFLLFSFSNKVGRFNTTLMMDTFIGGKQKIYLQQECATTLRMI
jgi:hypothetical protein